MHDRKNISNTEKIVYMYLQNALRDGSAKNAIEGLSNSGDNYNKAIKCLKAWFHLIHQTHVQMIVDAPAIRSVVGRSCDDCMTMCNSTSVH